MLIPHNVSITFVKKKNKKNKKKKNLLNIFTKFKQLILNFLEKKKLVAQGYFIYKIYPIIALCGSFQDFRNDILKFYELTHFEFLANNWDNFFKQVHMQFL